MKKPEENQHAPQEKGKSRKMSSLLYSIMDGSFLTSETNLRNLPFLIFLAVIGAFYIANAYNSEKAIRETNKITKELKDLNSEYTSLKSDLMARSNSIHVANLVAAIGLVESTEPPYKIYTEKPVNNQK